VVDDLCPPEQARDRLDRDGDHRAGLRPVLVGTSTILTGECLLVRRWGIFTDGLCTGTLGTMWGGRTLRHGLAVLQWRDYERFPDGTPCRLGVPYLAGGLAHFDPRCRTAWEAGAVTPASRRRPRVWPAGTEDCDECGAARHPTTLF
jgi:hypothetical protein